MKRALFCGLLVGMWGCGGGEVTPDTGPIEGVDAGNPDAPNLPDARLDTGTTPVADTGTDAFVAMNDSGPAEACGNGTVEGTEVCDDGNTDADDGCAADCTTEDGWTCDGADPTVCTETCGDGTVVGDEAGAMGCDDGDTTAGDGCGSDCTVETGYSCTGEPSVCMTGCGDGTIVGTEACDDGDMDSGDGCSAACAVESGFDCTGEPSTCTTTCGDGVRAGTEACDDDNTMTETSCAYGTASCTGCSAACDMELTLTGATCGDGAVLAGTETCDDGDAMGGDGCSATCATEMGFACSGEPSVCSTRCGDSVVAGTETCDDGNDVTESCTYGAASCTVCTSTCQDGPGLVAFCGDGRVGGPEACDDGNMMSGDGCEVGCTVTTGWSCTGTAPSLCTATCGDGRIAAGVEACDDGDTDAGDGCSGSCAVETAWACTGTPSMCSSSCGDAARASNEPCDDGNLMPGDGCSATCTVESGFGCAGAIGARSVCNANCGNGVLDTGETCDDADTDQTDGCAFCQVQDGYTCVGVGASTFCSPRCGDGLVIAPETCDDGWNYVSGASGAGGDGCSAACRIETGFTCTGAPSRCSRTLSQTVNAFLADYATVDSTITSTLSCNVADVTVTESWSVEHTFSSDVDVILIHGALTNEMSNDLGGADDLFGPYTWSDAATAAWPPVAVSGNLPAGTYRPQNPMSVFAGSAASGTWTHRWHDDFGADTGTIGSWSLTLTCRPN